MKNKRFEIFIIVFLVVFALIIFGIYLIFNKINESNEYVLIIKPYSVLSCKKFNCENVSSNKEEYNSKQYETYINNTYSGSNEIYYNSSNQEFYVNSASKNIFDNSSSLLGISGKTKISVIKAEYETVNSEELDVLSNNININLMNYNLFYPRKVLMDFDGDEKLESLYIINSNEDNDEYISALIYKNDEQYYLLDYSKTDNKIDKEFYNVYYFLDIFKDNKIEFLFTKVYYDNIGSCLVLYRIKDNRFVGANECVIAD